MTRAPAIAGMLGLTAALLLGAAPPPSRSVGTPQDGALQDGFEVPLTGAHHRFAGPVRARGSHFATLEVAALLARASRAVAAHLPGPPLVIGDISAEAGGPLRRHASHTSGRDVDLLCDVLDAEGRAVTTPGFFAFDTAGRCAREGCALQLDLPRTWEALRTLVASREPAVQYLFIARPLRALLLAWAEQHGEHPELLRRARRLLHQPRDASVHDDHVHMRTFCAPADLAAGCEDTGPRWPWVDGRGVAAPVGADPEGP